MCTNTTFYSFFHDFTMAENSLASSELLEMLYCPTEDDMVTEQKTVSRCTVKEDL
jgi:hypothetical protein